MDWSLHGKVEMGKQVDFDIPCHPTVDRVSFTYGGGWAPVSSPVFKTGGGSVKRAAVGSTPIHPRLVFGGEKK